MSKYVRPVAIVVAGVALLGAAGCSDDGADEVTKANQAYCASVAEVRAGVVEFQQMAASDASRGDLSVQADSVRASSINAVLDAKDLAEAIDQELTDAGEAFKASLEQIADESVSLDQARAEAASAAEAYLAEVDATAAEAGCPAS